MIGRRSHPRYVVATPWEGALRVLRDVAVYRSSHDELIAVSLQPAIAGEEMSLEVAGAGARLALIVRVVESRPVIVDGAVRHRIRLALLTPVERAAPVVGGH